jgi:hypothetical protein
MEPTQLALVRVSAKAGHVKPMWVQEVREDGWIACTFARAERPGYWRWFAPHNVISFFEPHNSYDYNGIKEGTLVKVVDSVGMVIRRRGAKYDILIDGSERSISWEYVVPVADPCNEPAK